MLKIANASKILDNFFEKIWVNEPKIAINDSINSMENNPIELVITKNQKENPAVTASALNRGEDSFMLNRINKCYKTALS